MSVRWGLPLIVGAALMAGCSSAASNPAWSTAPQSTITALSSAAASGSHPATESHSQVVNAVVSDCEATVRSLNGSGSATPVRYENTVDHLAAELNAVASRDGNPQEAAALRMEAADSTRYAADIATLSNAQDQHSTPWLSQQPFKDDLDRTLSDSQTLQQQYGIVCIPAGG